MKRVFGVDVGGTTIKFSIIDESGALLEQWAIPTDTSESGSNIPRDIAEQINGKLAAVAEAPLAIGVGIPGPVVGDLVERAVNLGWGEMPLGILLREATGLPVTLLNDANAAALGEAWMGGDSACRGGNAVFVTLGTGVGGGIIVGGRVMNGQHGCAGEIGHMPVAAPGERQCGCGKVNCLECYASATGFVKTANELYEGAGDPRGYTEGRQVFEQVAEGDPIAVRARDITVDLLARGLASIMCTVDPQEVIVGGGLSHAGDLLMRPLAEALERYVFPATAGKYVLRRATLGNDAGALGAAYQAFQMIGALD
ncbi:MAG: ROK family protein [Collinsella sp.]|nr:ROK family protein [Collinsella sp.]